MNKNCSLSQSVNTMSHFIIGVPFNQHGFPLMFMFSSLWKMQESLHHLLFVLAISMRGGYRAITKTNGAIIIGRMLGAQMLILFPQFIR